MGDNVTKIQQLKDREIAEIAKIADISKEHVDYVLHNVDTLEINMPSRIDLSRQKMQPGNHFTALFGAR